MKAVDLANLNSLITEVQKIRDEFTDASGKPPELLYRGQADSTWELTTTLERSGCQNMSFDDYYRLAVTRVRPTVEAFTNATWEAPDYDFRLADSFRADRELFSTLQFPSRGFYPYMVYLRHHGFPSPLLDWTWSMHVAAFFAFGSVGAAKKRSIYVYCERPYGGKGGAVGEPAIRLIGKYVRTHARHFRQQSDYTICAAFDERLGGWHFHRHDPVFWDRGKQDYLWKFDLPSTERIAVLKSLDEYNLNAFSLFDSQETLLETVWLREQIFKQGLSRTKSDSELLPLTGKSLAEVLRQYGYETHPKGMASPLGSEVEESSDGRTAYFDVNAEAVRKNREIPDRPIRVTLGKAGVQGGSPVWTLQSVEELARGMKSKALDRDPDTPRNMPWPD